MRRKLLQVTLLAAWLVSTDHPAMAQDSVHVDDRVRIWPSTDHRYGGRVLASWYPDSLTVLRSDSAWRPASARTNTVALSVLARLDLARGNQWKLGVLGALVAAVSTGIVVAVTQDVEDLSGPEVAVLVTAATAVVALPVGALVGSFYPQWHRIR